MPDSQDKRISDALEHRYNTTYENGRRYEDGGEDYFLSQSAIARNNRLLSDQKTERLSSALGGKGGTYGHQYEVYYAPPIDESNVSSKVIYRPVVRKLGTGAGVLNHQFTPVGAVAFPLPQGIVDSVKPSWEQGSAQMKGTAMAAGRVGMAGGAGALTGAAIGSVIPGVGTAIGAKLGGIVGIVGNVLSNAGSDVEAAIGSLTAGKVGIGSEASKARGAIVNTHEEQYFKGVDFRTFTFVHKLVARSERESLAISGIVDFMQKWASPRYKNGGTHIEYPAEFRINFLHGGVTNKNLPVINQCVCEGIDIAYSPDGNQFFETGAPTIVDITFNFKEAIIRTRDHIVTQEMGHAQQVRALQTKELGEMLNNRDHLRGVTHLSPEQYTGSK